MANRFSVHATLAFLSLSMFSVTGLTHDHKPYSFHGFASQAFLYSKGNNYLGESSEGGGSYDFYEAGIGGQYRFTPKFSLSGQLYARDAGRGDDGSVRVDYLYADARFFQATQSAAGVRVGRIPTVFIMPLAIFSLRDRQ